MSGKKIMLAYITTDSARKTTYKKRTKGLVKKVWPSLEDARRLLSEFKKLPLSKQNNKMVNQESFLEQSLAKATDQQLRKLREENRQKELKEVMFGSLSGKGILQSLNAMDLDELGRLVKKNWTDIADLTLFSSSFHDWLENNCMSNNMWNSKLP
ncbi:agamous-like MADS-box protein AGL80 [Gossypium hirsutum]|uniref:Agamous-like MADS-box protein AGL80 n=1 Tax=Gossypium hirsutum TaxID=3635 RepID=A0A1U8IFU8_GOSHI|nr:agamous-like MADS-box protein AGL80 [Gossypium hirsutum]